MATNPMPYTFGTATSAIPLSQLDTNFATPITLGNTAVYLNNTYSSIGNLSLANVTITSGTVAITNVSVTTANVSGTANISTLVVVGNETVGGNTSVTGNATVAGSVVLSGGTANGVAYLNTSKQLTTGSALVFDSSDRLIVGAASAVIGNRVEVVGNSSGQAIGIRGRASDALGVISWHANAASTEYARIQSDNTSALIFGTGSSGTEGFRLTSTSLYTASTINVGIGTSLPVEKLQSNKGVAASGANQSVGSLNAFVADYSSGNSRLFASRNGVASSTMQFWTTDSGGAANQAMTLDSNGNLLVGPTSLLLGAGNIKETAVNGVNGAVLTLGYNGALGAYLLQNGVNTTLNNQQNGYLAFNTNATERMRIDSAGIVTMSAYGAGAATFSAAGVISSVSDETWKTKDGVPTDPDAMLKKLEPGYWYYNDEKKETFGTDRQLGFYAQNVNAAIGPEAAPTPEEGKPWGYYDRSVLAITVMSLQKALATIETLTARITALEGA
jgi:hypothetical protein